MHFSLALAFVHRSNTVSLKHDGTDGTEKMANLPVPSVSVTDGTVRRLLKHDGADKRSKNA